MSNSHLNAILGQLKTSADIELGPAEAAVASPRQLEEARLDNEILTLALSNLTYVEIARHLDIPLPVVVRRIAAMLKGQPLGSAESMAAYLAHQLDLLQMGIESAMKDMADDRQGYDISEIEIDKVAGANRHNGRMALHKYLVHQAAILGLMRQRIDIERREKVEITVVNREDFEAL